MSFIIKNDLNFFNNFMLFTYIFIQMIIYLPKVLLSKNSTVSRKINQYTIWNVKLICVNYILNNYFNINNIFLSRFIAINSVQICILYHIIILYDKRVLFSIVNNEIRPFVNLIGINSKKYNISIVYFEYILIHILIHILPVYSYREYLINYDDFKIINMSIYTILFKFYWALNVFGNFDITKLYIPQYKGCNIFLFNSILALDYGVVYIIDNNLLNNYYKYLM